MNLLIGKFLNYMIHTKQASQNTVLAYKHDILSLESYLQDSGWQDIEAASTTALMAYVLNLHKIGKHAATISRNITVIKSFYRYLYYERVTTYDPAHLLKAPKFTRQPAPKLSQSEVDSLLETKQHQGSDAKSIRDRAIVAFIASTGLSSTVLIGLTLGNLNCPKGTLHYESSHEQHFVTLPESALELLRSYTNTARADILKRADSYTIDDLSAPLFLNMNGKKFSRQGLWKIIKEYGRNQAQANLSPRLLQSAIKDN